MESHPEELDGFLDWVDRWYGSERAMAMAIAILGERMEIRWRGISD